MTKLQSTYSANLFYVYYFCSYVTICIPLAVKMKSLFLYLRIDNILCSAILTFSLKIFCIKFPFVLCSDPFSLLHEHHLSLINYQKKSCKIFKTKQYFFKTVNFLQRFEPQQTQCIKNFGTHFKKICPNIISVILISRHKLFLHMLFSTQKLL